MGTRVDFYVGRGENAEWLGSYPFDGYPDGVFANENAEALFADPTEQSWRAFVADFLGAKGDTATLPEHGWPWPWEDSRTTDYAYAWEDEAIYGSSFGHAWFRLDPGAEIWGEPEDDNTGKVAVFPNMSERKAVTYGRRSGLIAFGVDESGRVGIIDD